MIKKIKNEMQLIFIFYFFLLFFQPFFILFYILIFLYLVCHFPFLCFSPKDQHLPLNYSSLTFTIYEKNILTHQTSLKESICEKVFPITYIKISVAPSQLFSCQQQSHISKLQEMYFQNFTDTFTGFVSYYYEIQSHSFIHSS